MTKTFKTFAITTISALAISGSAMAADMTEERVNELIKEYIFANPKVIVDALQQYQVQEEASRVKEQQDAVKKIKDTAFKSDHFPRAGNPDGDVMIVEFFDYNCPACKMMFESLDTVMKQDDKLNVIFVEYPIFGPQSETNAKIGLAVHALYPDKYFDFHTGLMRSKGKINKAQALSVAANLGMDKDKLEKEIEKPEYDEMIQKDRELAQKLQIRGTPAVIVGDKLVNSALRPNDLKTHIRWAREANEEAKK